MAVKLSPLVVDRDACGDSPSISSTIEEMEKVELNDEVEEIRGISCSARAYLPTSYSLLTHTTSHERLIRADSLRRLGLHDSHVDEIRTWPSSVLLQTASSPVKAAHDWSDASQEPIDELVEHLDEPVIPPLSTRSSPQGPQVRLSRFRTCPALRGLSHAHRHRESILASPRQTSNIDEFGKWKVDEVVFDPGNEQVSSVQSDTLMESAPPAITWKSCRNTFGAASLPSASDCTPHTPCATSFYAGQIPAHTTKTTQQSASCASLHSSSIRSRRRWQLDEILPSSRESMFRFPSLCVAAVETVSDVLASPSLASARSEMFTHEKQSYDDDCASLAMSGISALSHASYRPSDVALQSTLLGSPIVLAREVRWPSRSSSYDSDCSTPSMDCDLAFLRFPSLLIRPKSDSELIDSTHARRPKPLLQSESMPAIDVNPVPVPSSHASEKTDSCCARVSHQRSQSTASVQQIIHAQQCQIDEVRAKYIKNDEQKMSEETCADEIVEKEQVEIVTLSQVEGKELSRTAVKCVLEKAVQTESPSSTTTSSRRKSKSRRRRRSSKGRLRPRHSSSPKRAPGICISLPSPRVDEGENNDLWCTLPTHAAGRFLSVPVAVRGCEDDEREHSHAYDLSDPELSRQGSLGTSITSSSTSALHTDADLKSNADGHLQTAYRESTTTAAIEAMLDHLYRARDTKPDLSSGGRRHAQKKSKQSCLPHNED